MSTLNVGSLEYVSRIAKKYNAGLLQIPGLEEYELLFSLPSEPSFKSLIRAGRKLEKYGGRLVRNLNPSSGNYIIMINVCKGDSDDTVVNSSYEKLFDTFNVHVRIRLGMLQEPFGRAALDTLARLYWENTTQTSAI